MSPSKALWLFVTSDVSVDGTVTFRHFRRLRREHCDFSSLQMSPLTALWLFVTSDVSVDGIVTFRHFTCLRRRHCDFSSLQTSPSRALWLFVTSDVSVDSTVSRVASCSRVAGQTDPDWSLESGAHSRGGVPRCYFPLSRSKLKKYRFYRHDGIKRDFIIQPKSATDWQIRILENRIKNFGYLKWSEEKQEY